MTKAVQVKFDNEILQKLKIMFDTTSNAFVIEKLAKAGYVLLRQDIEKFNSLVPIANKS